MDIIIRSVTVYYHRQALYWKKGLEDEISELLSEKENQEERML